MIGVEPTADSKIGGATVRNRCEPGLHEVMICPLAISLVNGVHMSLALEAG
jgi:hypothetical protein